MIDPAALSILFDAHAAQAVLYARQWMDRASAEDVVQEVFVSLMLQSVLPANVKAWLFKAIRNASISQSRSSQRRHQREDVVADGKTWFEPHRDQSIDDVIDAAAASDALQSLPDVQREVIVLRIWGQLTLKEAAAVIGLPISTVFDHYRTGISSLREIMGATCQNKIT